MLLSMTGFGAAQGSSASYVVKVEIRSLNHRYLDIALRMPAVLRHYESNIRTQVAERLQRGKVDVLIEVISQQHERDTVDVQALLQYLDQLKPVLKKWKVKKATILPSLLALPKVIRTGNNEWTEQDWTLVEQTLQEAMDQLIMHRRTEGQMLEKALRTHTETIRQLLHQIDFYEDQRRNAVASRLRQQLEHWLASADFDQNRMEQELLFYLERMDFTEEKNRLQAHLSFFLTTLEEESSQGRRLSFLAQELGREINTLAAKAYHADIQKKTVLMKEELEKIKEQLLNVL